MIVLEQGVGGLGNLVVLGYPNSSNRITASRFDPAHPRGLGWKSAICRQGLPPQDRRILLTWLIVLRSRQVNLACPNLTWGGLTDLPLARDHFQRLGRELAGGRNGLQVARQHLKLVDQPWAAFG